MSTKKDSYYNETTNTIAGINTPPDHPDIAATDSLSEFVETMMDNIQHTFDDSDTEEQR
ncbi:hypothetical protein [Paenibacillus sp. YYML68]|uniref:hypothetical protein n=1 Tax=Paenibacillus sp. YYML68 TaxID=2909250 RepID=UPI002491EBF9|nr:hypothetical protein [Paenibacillus sp. YYML68]